MEDRRLLALLEEDPVRGMGELQACYSEILWNTAAKRLSNQDDIGACVQDTLTDFYMQRDKYDAEKGSLRAYLTTISDRKAIRMFQENRKQWLVEQLARPAEESQPDWERRQQLRQSLNCLAEEERLLLELRFYGGYSVREIAEQQDLPYETVKKRLQRVLKKLLRLMEE